MSPQDNIRIVADYVWNHSPEHVSEDLILHDYGLPEPVCGRQAVEQLLDTIFRTAFSDAKLEARHVTADDHRVVVEVTFHGVNTGSLRDHSPTGKRVELPVCGVCELEEGIIRSARVYYDSGLLERQPGWIPTQ